MPPLPQDSPTSTEPSTSPSDPFYTPTPEDVVEAKAVMESTGRNLDEAAAIAAALKNGG